MKEQEQWRLVLEQEVTGRPLRALCEVVVDRCHRLGGHWRPVCLQEAALEALNKHDYGRAASFLAVLIEWSQDWDRGRTLCPNWNQLQGVEVLRREQLAARGVKSRGVDEVSEADSAIMAIDSTCDPERRWRAVLEYTFIRSSLKALCKAAVEAHLRLDGQWTFEGLEQDVIRHVEEGQLGKAASMLAVLVLWSRDREASMPSPPTPTWLSGKEVNAVQPLGSM